MIEAKEIKDITSIDDVINILTDLESQLFKQSSTELIFYSVCHNHNDCLNHKPKLYYYVESKSFFCFSCGESFDIFSLVQQIKDIDFPSAIAYVCKICNIDNSIVYKEKVIVKDDWASLKRFRKKSKRENKLVIYDESILDFFDNIYHQSFLNDNISISSMNKFGLRFYRYKCQTIIPVYDENSNFVGIHCRNHIQEIIDLGFKYQPCKLLSGQEYSFLINMVLFGLNKNRENIIKTKTVLIFESPKAVLQMEDILECNNSVGLFGTNLSDYKRNLLLKLGVVDFVICVDKQYKRWYDEDDGSKDYEEFKKWMNKVNKIIDSLRGYGNISVVFDSKDLLEYKDSPSDKKKGIWDILYKNKEEIE